MVEDFLQQTGILDITSDGQTDEGQDHEERAPPEDQHEDAEDEEVVVPGDADGLEGADSQPHGDVEPGRSEVP